MTLRKIVFWMHLIAGITAGLVILIMSLTGVLLAYEKQIIAWGDRSLVVGAPPPGAERLPLQTLVDRVKDASGGLLPTTVTFYANSRAMSAATSGPTVYVDAYSGNVIGLGSTSIRGFFRTVTNWHRYLAMSGDSRATGRSITGAANFVFMIIVVAGVFLWLPRGKWTRQSLRGITWFKTGLNAKARNWNWHNVFGFWAAIPLFFVVLSGTVMSYPWASNLVYRIAGTAPPAQNNRGGQEGGQGRNGAPRAELNLKKIDPLVGIAERQVADWKTIGLRLPASGKAPAVFTIDRGNGGQPQLRATLTLDRETGGIVSLEKFEDQDRGRKARSWLRYVHTGEFYGFAGQTIAGIGSFAAVMLVWTGFALAWKRLASWVKSRKASNSSTGIQSSASEEGAA